MRHVKCDNTSFLFVFVSNQMKKKKVKPSCDAKTLTDEI